MNSRFPLPLTTSRLILHRLEDGDAELIRRYRSLPDVARYQSWESFSLEDAARLVASQKESEPGVPGTWLQLAIVERETGALLGDCGLHCLAEEPRQTEIGITLDSSQQGRGYATEALRAVVDFLFGPALDMHRVFAVTGDANSAAAALFRRLGFRQEAHFIEHRWYKGAWESEFVFGLLQREWRAR